MPSNPADTAKQWLDRARGSYARACQPKPPEAFWEDLCFDAQQAAEKALKALMIFRNLRFSYTHDIGKLLEQVGMAGVTVPAEILAAAGLSEYAVQTRYPGWGEPVVEDDYKVALAAAKAVLDWVAAQL